MAPGFLSCNARSRHTLLRERHETQRWIPAHGFTNSRKEDTPPVSLTNEFIHYLLLSQSSVTGISVGGAWLACYAVLKKLPK